MGGAAAKPKSGEGSDVPVVAAGGNGGGASNEQTINVVVATKHADDNADADASPLGNVAVPVATGQPVDRFLEDALPCKYLKRDLLGKGAFGEAYMVERVSDKRKFVGKVMDISAMSPKDKKYAHTEILCLAHAAHFAIIQYIEHQLVDEDTIVIIMEFADNGDLYNNIKKRNMVCSEKEAGMYFVQLLLALDHIHRRRMIHRDIKSANVFMMKNGLIKLGDFGFSQQYDQTVSGACATTFLGTPYYLAPEMWQGNRYGKKADVWAASIVLFEFLCGKRPFVATNMPNLKKAVLDGHYDVPEGISRDMKEFVTRALQLDPSRRPSAQEMLRTPLMQHYIAVLQKHVDESPDIDDATKKMLHVNITESATAIKEHIAEEVKTGAVGVRHEGVVYKESDSGSWKERYLILEDGHLTLTLAKGKDAAKGGDRSKRIPIATLLSAVPVSKAESTKDGDRFAFAISTENSSAIVFASASAAERDEWVQKLLEALDMA